MVSRCWRPGLVTAAGLTLSHLAIAGNIFFRSWATVAHVGPVAVQILVIIIQTTPFLYF